MKLHQRRNLGVGEKAALRATLASLPVTNGFSHSRRRKQTTLSFKIERYAVMLFALFAFFCTAALVAMKRSSSAKTLPFNAGDPQLASMYRQRFSARQLGYDIYNCPSAIPENYPKTWRATQILSDWNPNDSTTIAPSSRLVYQALCVFDYRTQYDMAMKYRDAELPFVVRNDPTMLAAKTKWADPDYFLDRLPDKPRFTERSPTNHFMYYNDAHQNSNWVKPQNDIVSMTYREWLGHALTHEGIALEDDEKKKMGKQLLKMVRRKNKMTKNDDDLAVEDLDSPEEKMTKWYYHRVNAYMDESDDHFSDEGNDNFIIEDLRFLNSSDPSSELYFVDSEDQRGINCRFGMRGLVAENHFDLSRNMINLISGERRYVIAHPDQCDKMDLYPIGHPSSRHSRFDWANPAEWALRPRFRDAQVSEVVLQAGDTLYLPTSWFHYIVNLSMNVQCNIRSGIGYENEAVVKKCGFKTPK